MNTENLQWHPGFYSAIQIELDEESQYLTFENEHQLSKKPMSIDTLVVKVRPGIKIEKNIGQIFRQYNIIEYKSPTDYVSINDFYKVLGYTCFYQSDTQKIADIKAEELTMTFVCCHFPRKLLSHLKRYHNIDYHEAFPGIFYLTGCLFPIQILVTKQLSKKENFWLSRMRTDLQVKEDLEPMSRAYNGKQKDPRYEAVMDLLLRANQQQAKEAKKMCEAIRELFADEYKEASEKGMAKGEALKLINQVMKKSAKGQTILQISEDLLEPVELIEIIHHAINQVQEDDAEKVYHCLKESEKN